MSKRHAPPAIDVATRLAVTKYRHEFFSLSVYLFFILALDTIDWILQLLYPFYAKTPIWLSENDKN